ncbi:uncharacterized protein LOC113312670 [Papaver somniferum]|uniref:uncharacterized protein LOC113312670 n=1 Tax=Papaver somniferum TaxID=3469 RepID=UPI000E6FDF6C|nr:uncharacterized protein LOC113312670 [Papaver somniferum]
MNSDKSTEDTPKKVPSIDLPDELFEEGLHPWKFSLIGRLQLHKTKFVDATIILRQQWKLIGDCKLIPLGKSFFTIKLDNEIDRNYIKAGEREVLNQEKILFAICKELGDPIKIDTATAKCEVGYYANVLVEMDFAQSIPSKIWINTKFGGFFQDILIHDRPKFCTTCKIIGHLVSECYVDKNKTKESVPAKKFQGANQSTSAKEVNQASPARIPFDIFKEEVIPVVSWATIVNKKVVTPSGSNIDSGSIKGINSSSSNSSDVVNKETVIPSASVAASVGKKDNNASSSTGSPRKSKSQKEFAVLLSVVS